MKTNKSTNTQSGYTNLPSSFRDPSGHLFIKSRVLYRSVASSYRSHYDHAKTSGLFEELWRDEFLVPHKEVDVKISATPDTYVVLQPEKIPLISYPYEWCFSELKDAALLTLAIQKRALEKGMVLKDASAFNVQFVGSKPIFIDTLSFEKYEEGTPWVAYRQFCEHFLTPLALMSYSDLHFGQLSRLFIHGIPLELASALLPKRTFFKPLFAAHIHLHAKSKQKFATQTEKPTVSMSRSKLNALIDSLESVIKSLDLKKQATEWGEYYDHTNYSSSAFTEKKRIVSAFLDIVEPQSVWDVGANTGVFSRVASERGIPTIAFDIDPVAVDVNYRESKKREDGSLLPLVLDLTNPSPGIGWAHEERDALEARGPADTLVALALVHHLAIGNNLPFAKIAEYFSRLGKSCIIEFVPKSDSQVKRLLRTREDIFPDYTEEQFEEVFGAYFTIQAKEHVPGSHRTIYLMSRK